MKKAHKGSSDHSFLLLRVLREWAWESQTKHRILSAPGTILSLLERPGSIPEPVISVTIHFLPRTLLFASFHPRSAFAQS